MFDRKLMQILVVCFYVSTGVAQPILIEVLSYNGACEKSTFLSLMTVYVGMSISVVSNWGALKQGQLRWVRLTTLVLIDLGSGILLFTGLVSAGSAIFTVVYSSVTVYTAIFSWLFFGRQLHNMQWFGVCLVMTGLISSSFGSQMLAGTDSEDVGLGILMIIVGSMFHSLYYIVSESILKDDDPIAPEFLATFQGIFGCVVFGLWQLLYTIPRWGTLVRDEIAVHNGDLGEIAITYCGLVIVNFIHGVCLFHMLKMVGSTTTGVLKGIISVLVFIISHFAFCSLQQSQCFSVAKGLSLVVVVVGVVFYSMYKYDGDKFPQELRPRRMDLLSKASTVWIHREQSRQNVELLNMGRRKGSKPRMKRVNSRTLTPFENYDTIAPDIPSK